MNPIQQPRRKFLETGIAGFCAALFAGLPKVSLAQSGSDTDKGIVVHEDEGIQILSRRKVPITVKISKAKHGIDGISFCVEDMSPGRKMRVKKYGYTDVNGHALRSSSLLKWRSSRQRFVFFHDFRLSFRTSFKLKFCTLN